MLTLVRRVGTTAAGAGLVVAVMAAPSDAAAVPVTLSPSYGPVGSVVDVTAADGLDHVTAIAFGAGAAHAVTPTGPTAIQVRVPADATTGRLTLTYDDASTARTDDTFTVQQATTATGSPRRSIVVPGHTVMRARLTSAGVGVAGRPARLLRAPAGTDRWSTVRPVETTGDRGQVHWRVEPRHSSDYRVLFPASHAYAAAATRRTRVVVHQFVKLVAPAVAPRLTRIRLHGRVRPAPPNHGRVLLDQRVDGTWHQIDHARTHDGGHYRFHVTFDQTGRQALRVRRPADRANAAGHSGAQVVHVEKRTLQSGMSGPDVTRLQKRLKHLRYDVGHVTGEFGYDTLHAVIAFEKVQGMTRDGVVGPAVWKRLGDPVQPHLRHPADAATKGVEVDLTRQVVYYAVDGQIRRIIDASTGGGYTYTGSDGAQHTAITPTGHYSVLYKVNEWQTSPLGRLYRPAYFRNDGYAIHGEGSVPSYPASHGCVRITVPAMDRFYDKFDVGMSVWIYRS